MGRIAWDMLAVACVCTIVALCLLCPACCHGQCAACPQPKILTPATILAGGKCSCSPFCSCGCQQGKPCGELCDWPGRRAKAECGCGCNSAACECEARDCQCKTGGKLCSPACDCLVGEGRENYGVEWSKIRSGSRCRHRGRDITPEQASRLLQGKLPDDAGLIRLTVIGPDAARRPVMTDLQSSPELGGEKRKVVVQEYPSDAPLLAGLGFVTSGSPTIYLQAPDGRVLHRQDAYRGPAMLAEAIRKADKSYRQEMDPDLNAPPKASPATPFKLPDLNQMLANADWKVCGLCLFAVILLLATRRQQQ